MLAFAAAARPPTSKPTTRSSPRNRSTRFFELGDGPADEEDRPTGTTTSRAPSRRRKGALRRLPHRAKRRSRQRATPSRRRAAPKKARATTPTTRTTPSNSRSASSSTTRSFRSTRTSTGSSDRKSLLDAFLLTTIAQVGVESAVFLEQQQGLLRPGGDEGHRAGRAARLRAVGGATVLAEVPRSGRRGAGREISLRRRRQGAAAGAGLHVRGAVRRPRRGARRRAAWAGRIKNDLDTTTIDFLKILINQAAIAYESMARFEEENERTLGIGADADLAHRGKHAGARQHEPDHAITCTPSPGACTIPTSTCATSCTEPCLRDIGMIKVSDLIVRSPRELMPEEWEIIKRHPSDGAKMLTRHEILRAHHRRGAPPPRAVQRRGLSARHAGPGHSARRAHRVGGRELRGHAAGSARRAPRSRARRRSTRSRRTGACATTPKSIRCFVEVVEEEIRSGGATPATSALRSSACDRAGGRQDMSADILLVDDDPKVLEILVALARAARPPRAHGGERSSRRSNRPRRRRPSSSSSIWPCPT